MINALDKTQHKTPYSVSDLISKFYGGQLTPTLTQPYQAPEVLSTGNYEN